MKNRVLSLLLCLCVAVGLLPVTARAALTKDMVSASGDFQVTYYNEDIYAGGILDMRAFVGESDMSGYTFRWQTDASLGEGHWYDLEDNATYKGTATDHLQFHSTYNGNYTDWDKIPFRCVVTKNGVTKYTPSMYMHIYPSDSIVKVLKNKGMSLFEPNLTDVTDFSAKNDLTYTANADAGSNIKIRCGGSTESSVSMLVNSEVQLKREIKITENGKYIVSGDQTNYIPYTVGSNAVKIEINMRIVVAGVDRGVYQTKTVNLTTKKPNITATGKAKSACSLLRYTYNESEKLASIAKGTNLELVGKEGSYYQVYYNGFVGYVAFSLVDAALNEQKTIDHVELSMAVPRAGNVWPSSVTVKPDSCTATSVEWYDKTDGHYLEPGERFVKGHDYQLVVWATAKEDYQFKLDSSNNMLTTAVLNGTLPCFTSRAYEQENGKVIDIRYDFNNVQEAEPTTPSQPQHTHDYADEWSYNFGQHYKHCTADDCYEIFFVEAHSGGVATCSQKGKCTVCGYAYLEENDTHNSGSEWTSCGSLYHAHICKDCGTHCDAQEHVAGPAGMPDAAVVCKDCGYIITPAKDHTHKLTKVEEKAPTCTQPGNCTYYTCDGCSTLFADAEGKHPFEEGEDYTIAPLGHKISEILKYDAQNHWRICETCQTVMEETKMCHEGKQCATCGYVYGTEIKQDVPETEPAVEDTQAPAEPTEPTTSNAKTPNKGTQKDKDLDWVAITLIGAACLLVALSVTVAVVVLTSKKKEKQE